MFLFGNTHIGHTHKFNCILNMCVRCEVRKYLKENEGSTIKDANLAWSASEERANIIGGRQGIQM